MDQFGAAGLAAAVVTPGLLAAVDQHAAVVRDILLLGVEGAAPTPSAVLLAGYARRLLDQYGMDVRGVARQVDGQWPGAGWLALRLLGVCALSRADDWARPMPEIGVA